jgi:hypothetical protein
MLNSHDTFEYLLSLGIFAAGRNNTGAIDEVDTLHECNILPDFGLARNRSDIADLLSFDGIDDAAFADIGVANEANRNLLLVGHEIGELTEELNKGTFAEGVVDGCMEGDGRVRFGEILYPASLFVQDNRKERERETGSCVSISLLLSIATGEQRKRRD